MASEQLLPIVETALFDTYRGNFLVNKVVGNIFPSWSLLDEIILEIRCFCYQNCQFTFLVPQSLPHSFVDFME